LSEPIGRGGSPWSPARHAAERRKILAMKQPNETAQDDIAASVALAHPTCIVKSPGR
jgi:hypothetical protein